MRILVVDDDQGIRVMLGAILEACGHQALLAGDGAAGLALLRDDPTIDLIITDGAMPMDGPQMLMRRAGPLPPAIGMTCDPEYWGRAFRAAGCREILEKPFDVGGLLRAVERVAGVPIPA